MLCSKIWKFILHIFKERTCLEKESRFLQNKKNKDNKWKSLIHRVMFSSFRVVFFTLYNKIWHNTNQLRKVSYKSDISIIFFFFSKSQTTAFSSNQVIYIIFYELWYSESNSFHKNKFTVDFMVFFTSFQ